MRLKVRPIRKSSISDDIVQQIITLISNGDLKAGQRLPSERDLCVKFAASRSSLREALRCLSIMGVLTARPGEGTSVAMDGTKFMDTVLQWRMSTEQHDIEDLMEVRMALEGVTASSAAKNAEGQDLKKLEDLVARMEESVGDARRFAALDLEFHLCLAKASNNKLALDLVAVIRGQLERGVAKVLQLPDAMPLSVEEHKQILQAVMNRDSEQARAAMQHHLQAAVLRHRAAVEASLRQEV
ncbi:FadR/GntR family transcriptional regulator [Edaphobacter sp. 12200R-103]|jgi:GntR family transcriptional repressor for pyruvate dehydrogenase complex|uniref:FadR/GntR family transcriptional regulator n=1 Tax=Edaphobacter sp. 12200R-103 TaxID=2703788 RepID=UPI00138D4695|nr:FadR/GntR family transcriptional regulator [Edaphobacter sp. 12200R-103]QHS52198.1 FadR family transcriptional regulator [Edaphobacter sp. 12200R-103]